MSRIWRWIFGIVIVLAILGLLGFGSSNRQAYRSARQADRNAWQDITWKWARNIDQSKGTVTIISEPEKYTILFKADGTLEGKADCNNFSGTYSQENGGFFIQLGPSTMAFCGEESIDREYLALLGSIVAGGPAGGDVFALETAGGEKRMEFDQ